MTSICSSVSFPLSLSETDLFPIQMDGTGITNFFSITLMLYQEFVFQHEFFGADILYKLFVMAYKKDSDILFL